MSNDLLQTFTTRFETLRGHVHRASSHADAAEQIRNIIRESEATCVALGDLPAELMRALTDLLASDNIRVVQPPYAAADLPGVIDGAQVGVGYAQHAIAQTGTLIEIVQDDAIRLVSSLPRTYIGVVYADNMVPTLMDAAPILRQAHADNDGACIVSFISGPSRTGDIEMILTLGVHGPEVAHTVLLDAVREGGRQGRLPRQEGEGEGQGRLPHSMEGPPYERGEGGDHA